MKKNKNIKIVIIAILTLFFLTGCSEKTDTDLNTKVISELEYIDMKTIDMLNKLNNISFESYYIVSEQVQFDGEEKQTSQNQSEKSSENANATEEGENSGNTNQQGDKQAQSETNNEKINATNMVMNAELDKDRNDIDWTTVKNEIELLEESWSIIILDLYTLNVKSETIQEFSNKLNTCLVTIRDENKEQSLMTLASLYSSIPEILQELNAEKNMLKIKQTQNYVINAYVLAENMDNIEIEKNLKQAINIYSEIMSDIDYTKDKTQKTNKVYVLLNEILNSISKKDADVFYIKYKNFMKEIQSI